jgi:hypothetical protein
MDTPNNATQTPNQPAAPSALPGGPQGGQPVVPAPPAQPEVMNIPIDQFPADLRDLARSKDFHKLIELAKDGHGYRRDGFDRLREKLGEAGLQQDAFPLLSNWDVMEAIMSGSFPAPEQQVVGPPQPAPGSAAAAMYGAPAAQAAGQQAPQAPPAPQQTYISREDFEKAMLEREKKLMDQWDKKREQAEAERAQQWLYDQALREQNEALGDVMKAVGRERKPMKIDLGGIPWETDPSADIMVRGMVENAVHARRDAMLNHNDPMYPAKRWAPLTKTEVQAVLPHITPIVKTAMLQAAEEVANAQARANLPQAALTGQGPGGSAIKAPHDMTREEYRAELERRTAAKLGVPLAQP